MKTTTISCLYHQMEVNFLLNPFNSNIMINATQMAKIFGKEPKDFLRLDCTKKFIEILENRNYIVADVPRYNDEITSEIVYSNNKAGTFMHRKLALKLSSWLDVEFEMWVYDTIDNILFGNYKKHWEAHTLQEEAKERMLLLKEQMLTNPTAEMVLDYFEQERIINATNTEKRKAIKDQIHLFNYLQENN